MFRNLQTDDDSSHKSWHIALPYMSRLYRVKDLVSLRILALYSLDIGSVPNNAQLSIWGYLWCKNTHLGLFFQFLWKIVLQSFSCCSQSLGFSKEVFWVICSLTQQFSLSISLQNHFTCGFSGFLLIHCSSFQAHSFHTNCQKQFLHG